MSYTVRFSSRGTHIWPCKCPEHIGTDKRPPGHTIEVSWYQPLDDRELVLAQAQRMVRALVKAGFSNADILIDGESATKELMEAYGI